MSDNEEMDMYDTDGFEPPTSILPDNGISVTQKGMVTELDMNGKKFEVVNPEYIREMQRLVSIMETKIRDLDRTIKRIDRRSMLQDRVISNLRSQLDGKIDRE